MEAKPFLNIDVFHLKKILKEIINYIDNKTVLEKEKQREEILITNLRLLQTLLKIEGAIDVLTQIEEANAAEDEEGNPAETEDRQN